MLIWFCRWQKPACSLFFTSVTLSDMSRKFKQPQSWANVQSDQHLAFPVAVKSTQIGTYKYPQGCVELSAHLWAAAAVTQLSVSVKGLTVLSRASTLFFWEEFWLTEAVRRRKQLEALPALDFTSESDELHNTACVTESSVTTRGTAWCFLAHFTTITLTLHKIKNDEECCGFPLKIDDLEVAGRWVGVLHINWDWGNQTNCEKKSSHTILLQYKTCTLWHNSCEM